MIRVLFVCLGNICRSPMAEAVFSDMVRNAGLSDRIEAHSAGTGHWHLGESPHEGTRRILKRNRIDYNGRARLLTEDDLQRFDHIITMDEANRRDVVALGPARGRIALLMSFAQEAGVDEVPDPYYTGRFDEVYELVTAGCTGLLGEIRREHGL